jgi:hypothetical protein
MATRREVLEFRGLLIEQGTYHQTPSPTLSTYRARWHSIQHWSTFLSDFNAFWTQVTEAELSTIVDPQRYVASISHLLSLQVTAPPTSERELYPIFNVQFMYTHNMAASPDKASHFHATIHPCSNQYQPIGDPDYIFVHGGVLAGVIEVKTFWKVTRESISEVLEGTYSCRWRLF